MFRLRQQSGRMPCAVVSTSSRRAGRWGTPWCSRSANRPKAEKATQAESERLAAEARQSWDAWEASKLEIQGTDVDGVMLKKGEIVYLAVEGAGFVEPRRAPGHWAGRSSGYSFRVAKGVSYRIGASKGQYVQGDESPTVTDTATFVVTNQRSVFVGSKRTTEWAYSTLLGFSLDGEAVAIFNVSNRQKATGVKYTVEIEPKVDALIAAAIARFQGEEEHAALMAELEQDHRRAYGAWENAGALAPPTV
jgi:hypothetical protein